jgi:geranylgeranyl reductase
LAISHQILENNMSMGGAMVCIAKTDVLVVGGGPGGLACATLLAQHGLDVVLIERKPAIGPKVCAGGITWHGLIRMVPETLIERAFPEQAIFSDRQQLVVRRNNPIIATVSREKMGQWMARQAEDAGVRIWTSTRLVACGEHQARLDREGRGECILKYAHLVGADGSNSRVRRFLGVATENMGIGLNAMVPKDLPRMEWHLCPRLFGSGYAWIFPHSGVSSVGAYADQRCCSALHLRTRLLQWCDEHHLALQATDLRAGWINFDYQGVRFDKGYLVGDAAGLASGLTGEGIYPALVSGQAVARMILDPAHPADELARLVRKHRRHQQMALVAGRFPQLGAVLMELLLLLLRWKLIDFHALEMAD